MFRYQFLTGLRAKRAYLYACSAYSAAWLRASAADPSPHMTRTHIALQLVAARRQDHIAAYYDSVEREEGWAA